MDKLTKELIAIGASVTAGCEPCLKYHLKEAKANGASEEQVLESIEVGKMVKKGAMAKYNEFISTLTEGASGSTGDTAVCG